MLSLVKLPAPRRIPMRLLSLALIPMLVIAAAALARELAAQ